MRTATIESIYISPTRYGLVEASSGNKLNLDGFNKFFSKLIKETGIYNFWNLLRAPVE